MEVDNNEVSIQGSAVSSPLPVNGNENPTNSTSTSILSFTNKTSNLLPKTKASMFSNGSSVRHIQKNSSAGINWFAERSPNILRTRSSAILSESSRFWTSWYRSSFYHCVCAHLQRYLLWMLHQVIPRWMGLDKADIFIGFFVERCHFGDFHEVLSVGLLSLQLERTWLYI